MMSAADSTTAAATWLSTLLSGDLGEAWNEADPGFRERVARYGLADWHSEIEAGGGTVLTVEWATANSREGDALWEIPEAFLAELRTVLPTDGFDWAGSCAAGQDGYEIATYGELDTPLRFLMKRGDDGWRLAGIAAIDPLPGWPAQVSSSPEPHRRSLLRRWHRGRSRRRP